ncbi:exocyst complex component EXO70B2-like [Lolium rigidum]|uniref:exocyst complex component EXO70B2-like n=1 Tax=Lolium rigidum TaxID=89674 RepID=UPI001F5D572F|nr:exocyst complex component EXO70B2-like [Lolium rigidum]
MAGRLATVPEESADGSTAAYPPRGLYLDLIQSIAVSGAQIRSTLFSHSGESGSSYSSGSRTSGSYPSHNSGCSSGSAQSAAPADFCTRELKTIARRMVSDGYTQRMVKAFNNASPDQPNRVLESWFLELDVDWVLQICEKHGSQGQLWLQDKSASSLQDLVARWIRGLTVIVHSICELVFPDHNELEGVARFGKASITGMLAFVDAAAPLLKAEKLQAVLGMYICVCTLYMIIPVPMHTESRIIFNEIRSSLAREGNSLKNAIFSTMKEARTLVEEDDLWAIEILRGRGEVHRNARLMVNYILYMKKAVAMLDHFAPVHKNSSGLKGLINDTIDYLKDLLSRKSELCSDPSLRYLFLLNNSYFVAQQCEPSRFSTGYARDKIQLTPECQNYMHSYLHVSWGHVLSCIRKSRFPGPIHRWINTSSVAKFELAVRKTCQAHKFWKVPDPLLRNELRGAIATRVVSGYRRYLEEHPELQKHVGHGGSSPEILEDMLGDLFEG